MGNSVRFKLSSVAVMEEVTENTYQAPSSANDYVEVKEGFVPEITREELEREILDGSRERRASRKGVESTSLPLPVELKSSATEGGEPQVIGKLFKGLLGNERSVASDYTTDTGHTANTLNMQLGEGSNFTKGDCFVMKAAGAYSYHAVESVVGDVITFFPSLDSAPADGVVISKSKTYFVGSTTPSYSAEVNYGDEQKDKLKGLKVASCSMAISAGQLPTCDFSLQGNREGREVAASSFDGDFSTLAEPPVATSACAYFKFEDGDEEKLGYETMNVNIENEINDKLDACAKTGKGSPVLGQITVSGDINPYMFDSAEVTALDRFNAFDKDEDVAMFIHLQNATSVDGESENHVMIYMPKVKFTNVQAQNLNDLIVDQVNWVTAKGDNNNETFFISFV